MKIVIKDDSGVTTLATDDGSYLDMGAGARTDEVRATIHPGTGSNSAGLHDGFAHHNTLMGSFLEGGYAHGYLSTGFSGDGGRQFSIGASSGTTFSTATYVPILSVHSGTGDVILGGNIGIGVTPESWEAGNSVLQIGGDGALLSSTTSSVNSKSYFSHNTYYDSVDARWEYIGDSSNEATLYRQQDGAHAFFVTAAGAADAAISWTEALTIDNAGDTTLGGGLTVDGDTVTVNNVTTSQSIYFDGTGNGRLSMGVSSANSYLSAQNVTAAGSSLIIRTDDAAGSIQTALTIDSSQDVTFARTAKFASGEGVVFNGDSIAAVNTLDDYEEGEWTVGMTFAGGNTGMVVTAEDGHYTKIGNLVHCMGLLNFSAKGTSTGQCRITGLPFTVGSQFADSSFQTGGTASYITGVSSVNGMPSIVPNKATTLCTVYDMGDAAGTVAILDHVNISDALVMRFYFSYYV